MFHEGKVLLMMRAGKAGLVGSRIKQRATTTREEDGNLVRMVPVSSSTEVRVNDGTRPRELLGNQLASGGLNGRESLPRGIPQRWVSHNIETPPERSNLRR
jgi:hypothetical protein